MLKDITFSDMLLYEDEPRARLKECISQRLIHVPEECIEETNQLKAHISEEFNNRTSGVSALVVFNDVRYRVSQLQDVQRGRVWFLRRLADFVPSMSSLNVGDRFGSGMFAHVSEWLMAPDQTQGLVLFIGAQGSGKTTLASAYIADRLTKYGGHAVTFEGPPELPLAGDWGDSGTCFQVEINNDDELTQEVEFANRYGSPNIVFFGEIRTKCMAREALRMALGSRRQIVVATIHGLSLVAGLQRLVNWAKELEGDNARDNLSMSLLAALQLSLEENSEGNPTVVVPEFLLLPFTDKSLGVRSKLKEGKISALTTDISEQYSFLFGNVR